MKQPSKAEIRASSTKARNNYDVLTFKMYSDMQLLLGKLSKTTTKDTLERTMIKELWTEVDNFYKFTKKLSELCDCRCTKDLVCSCGEPTEFYNYQNGTLRKKEWKCSECGTEIME